MPNQCEQCGKSSCPVGYNDISQMILCENCFNRQAAATRDITEAAIYAGAEALRKCDGDFDSALVLAVVVLEAAMPHIRQHFAGEIRERIPLCEDHGFIPAVITGLGTAARIVEGENQ